MSVSDIKVSVIIPVYNSGRVLERTVAGVLAQTLKEFELILIDDGSTDIETVKLVDDLVGRDGRIRVIHQDNKGLCLTCDVGVHNAQAKYVYIVDQDDFIHPQLLETAFDICESNNLDYLGLRWKNADVGQMPECKPYSKTEIEFGVVDNASLDATDFCRIVGKVHVDAWSQFLTRELSLEFPFETFGRSGRTFKCIYSAHRWGILYNELYYYSVNNNTSIMHKPLQTDWVNELHTELDNVYDIAYAPKTDHIGRMKFDSVCKLHLVEGIKTLFHMIKRSNRNSGLWTRVKLWRTFSSLLADFIFIRRIPVADIGVKHFIEYMFITLLYGGIFARRVSIATFHGSSKNK